GRFFAADLRMQPGVERAADGVEPVADRRRPRFAEGQDLRLVALAPRPRIEPNQGTHFVLPSTRARPVATKPLRPRSCASSVVAPSAVSRYGRRRSSGSSASIRPRRSRRASAPYSVPGPIGLPDTASTSVMIAEACLRPSATETRLYHDEC